MAKLVTRQRGSIKVNVFLSANAKKNPRAFKFLTIKSQEKRFARAIVNAIENGVDDELLPSIKAPEVDLSGMGEEI